MENTQKISRKRKKKTSERVIETLIRIFAIATVFITVGIIFTLLMESLKFFDHVSLLEFLTGTVWTPLMLPAHFGVLPLVVGTFTIAILASIVAIPLGLGTAIYLSEYATSRLRKVLKPALELLAGIPSIVYGYFALTFITPMLRTILPDTEVFNSLSASIAVGIMIIPLVASLSEDAMNAIPNAMRSGAYALGSTRLEVATKIVIPAAKSGIVASFVLAISRAIGETMIVAIAAGASPNLTFNPLRSIQTMTGYMVSVSTGDISVGSMEYQTIFAVGLLLFFITFALNLFARKYISNKRR
ncbi:MAG TPA: phosphate ABC transporter permease subunit PstC [Clostridiaceae bacterium]|nr:phosphate ABC transporter permease subunit PstC [Clostridiaceae bacterium]